MCPSCGHCQKAGLYRDAAFNRFFSSDPIQIEGTNSNSFPEGIQIRERITLDCLDIEGFPDSIADDVELIWTKKLGIGREEVAGPKTAGEFRAMKRAPNM